MLSSDSEDEGQDEGQARAPRPASGPIIRDMVHAKICKAVARVLRSKDVPAAEDGKTGMRMGRSPTLLAMHWLSLLQALLRSSLPLLPRTTRTMQATGASLQRSRS